MTSRLWGFALLLLVAFAGAFFLLRAERADDARLTQRVSEAKATRAAAVDSLHAAQAVVTAVDAETAPALVRQRRAQRAVVVLSDTQVVVARDTGTVTFPVPPEVTERLISDSLAIGGLLQRIAVRDTALARADSVIRTDSTLIAVQDSLITVLRRPKHTLLKAGLAAGAVLVFGALLSGH